MTDNVSTEQQIAIINQAIETWGSTYAVADKLNQATGANVARTTIGRSAKGNAQGNTIALVAFALKQLLPQAPAAQSEQNN
ncbi:hypothetical protein [Aliagarivorans taiwanensis]|uniref:hypothetical protein n=1 Tax=Aliagarivorans taiwanensis TaxID=561966 RepID=UPI0003FEA2FA|nr:hypothetical protein [Aliagarivorans taiwanensis]